MPFVPPVACSERCGMRRNGPAARLAVLVYHRIGDPAQAPPGMVSATPRAFERQAQWLASRRRPLSLDDVLAASARGATLPPGAVLVTFDDAYADFATHAWPVLRRHRIPVTLFVPTAFPADAGAAFWWDRLHAALAAAREPLHTPLGCLDLSSERARRQAYRALRNHVKALPHDEGMALVDSLAARLPAGAPTPRVLSWDELRALAADGVTLAPHTRTHPRLDRLPPERLADEVGGSVAELRAHTGAAAPAFAYPAGGVSPAAVEAVRAAGIQVAFTTAPGVAELREDRRLVLPRLGVGRRTSLPVLRACLAAPGAAAVIARARARRRRPTPPPARDARPAVAYVMSRFPKLTETFVLAEILALDRRGVRVEVYPLLRERAALVHPEARAVVGRAHYLPFLSPAVVASQLYWLRHRPRAYMGALRDVAAGTRGSLNFLAGGLACFPKVAHAARLMQADGVVHVHCHFANHPAVAGFVTGRLTGLPYSFTAHGSDLHRRRQMLAEKVAEAAFVATVSEHNRRLIVGHCGGRFAEKVHVIRAGVDTTAFVARRNGHRAPGPLRVLCVGTLHAVKGQAHLVEACGLLAAAGIEVACRLVGDGPDRAALARQIARAGLAGRVVLVGARTRPDVAAELAAAEVLVAPSVPTRDGRREGIPVVLMEAMSSGVPVVASELSGIPELVEHGTTGLLVAPGDPAALAAALRALYEDPALPRRLGECGRARVVQHFDVERSVTELVERFALRGVA
jgi:colanic acid/amylovoran biosynthesis glycosyltransferase